MKSDNEDFPYSVKKTIDHIENLLSSGTLKSGDFLPPTRILAKELNVSLLTVQKAVHIFVKEKKLVIEKSMGIRTPYSDGKCEEALVNAASVKETAIGRSGKYTWKRTMNQVQEDIMNGVYRHGKGDALPSIKELESKYGTCYQTMKKAIIALTKSGVISHEKKIARLNPEKKFGISTIVLVTSDQSVERKLMNTRGYMLMRSLEIECRNMHIHFEIVFNSKTMFSQIEAIQKNYILLGVIVDCLVTDDMIASVRQLQPLMVPLAVIDHAGIEKPPIVGRNTQFYTFGGITTAGKDMAHHLLPFRHTKAAFFSAHHGEDTYSQRRFVSFKNTFEAASAVNTVSYLGYSPEDNHYHTDAKILTPPPFDARHLAHGLLRESKIFIDAANALSSQMSTRIFLNYLQQYIDGSIGFFTGREIGYYIAQPLFELALIQPDITAWICEDDFMAVNALCFLESAGKRVPKDISVTGFEDNDEAFHYNLTTYNFNMPALISRCLRFIQYPSVERKSSRSTKPIEIIGHVIERKTTGQARCVN